MMISLLGAQSDRVASPEELASVEDANVDRLHTVSGGDSVPLLA